MSSFSPGGGRKGGREGGREGWGCISTASSEMMRRATRGGGREEGREIGMKGEAYLAR